MVRRVISASNAWCWRRSSARVSGNEVPLAQLPSELPSSRPPPPSEAFGDTNFQIGRPVQNGGIRSSGIGKSSAAHSACVDGECTGGEVLEIAGHWLIGGVLSCPFLRVLIWRRSIVDTARCGRVRWTSHGPCGCFWPSYREERQRCLGRSLDLHDICPTLVACKRNGSLPVNSRPVRVARWRP